MHWSSNITCSLQKSSLATFSHWERSFSASLALHSLHLLSCTKHIISVLRNSKLVILCIEALNDLLCKKALTHENLSSALQITFHFMKKNIFHVLELNLKIEFSTFLSLRKKLSASWPCILFICLVALNTALVFLALTALVFLALKKSSKHENLSSALQITFHFMRKKYLSYTWALLLKLHLATFSHWERSFSASVALDSLHA